MLSVIAMVSQVITKQQFSGLKENFTDLASELPSLVR